MSDKTVPQKKLTLNTCTKADLLWIINRILQRTAPFNQDYELLRALNDLAYEKEKQQLDKADQYGQVAYQKRQEYADLLRPYDGKPIKDIPQEVLEKAYALLEEAAAADKMFAKLIGVDA